MPVTHLLLRMLLLMVACLFAGLAVALPYAKGGTIHLKEYVGKEWVDELIHYDLTFTKGEFPNADVRLLVGGKETPCQLSDVTKNDDGSLKSATLWLVTTLHANEVQELSLTPGKSTAASDLQVSRKDGVLQVTTALTGARLNLLEKTFDPPIAAEQVPPYLTTIRQRGGAWGGRGWFETPHKCRKADVWVMEEGPVFVKVGFKYAFDGYRGDGKDLYQGFVRIAARQELIQINEEFSLGDPKVYQFWKPKNRADEISWDWWQWRAHDAESNFCFSFYEGLQPTKARWFGHNASQPEKRTGPVLMQLDHETDYTLTYKKTQFEVDVSSTHGNRPDLGLSYMAWRGDDPKSDALGIIGLQPVDWIHPDMLPRSSKAINQHTNTADLRLFSTAKPDLLLKAPLHLGKRSWGFVTLQMPDAGPTQDEVKDGKIVKYAFQKDSSQALKLRNKYGDIPLDKVKDWALEWTSTKTYPSLFIKEGGLPAVLQRIRSSQILRERARSLQYKPINRYLLNGGEKHAQDAYADMKRNLDAFISGAFVWGYNAHNVGLNINQFPWWMQEYSAQFDLLMGMPEITAPQKEALRARYAFCVHMLHDPNFLPPRANGVGWGSANMPVNMRGAQAVTACVLSDNPDAKPWLALAVEMVDVLVQNVWAPDGSNISGPHYTGTQADPLMNMALPLYYAGAIPPIQQKYPQLANFTRLMIDRMTPPEPRARYTRLLPTIGHTMMEPDSNIGKYALLMNLTDRKLGGEAFWMWKRAGGELSGFMDGIYYMNEDFNEQQPNCRSVVYPGSTTILRNGFPREDETYMAIHVGNWGFDHYDRDIGSFLIYAKGVPLMMDFSSMYTPNCWQSIWHNTLTWNVKEGPLKVPCPGRDNGCFYTKNKLAWYDHQYEPHTLLDRDADSQTKAADGFKELGGEARAHAFSPEADYMQASMPLAEFQEWPWVDRAESDNPQAWGSFTEFRRLRLSRSYEWQRRYLFVKDEDLQGPNYFVIADDLDGQAELTPQANYWCLADSQRITGDLVRWKGQYQVDLDMYVAWPKKPQIQSREWWHTQRGPAQAEFKNGREYQIAAHLKNQPGNGGFTVMLYPRGRYEVQPTYTSSKDGKLLQVTIGARKDVILCTRQPYKGELGGVRMEGTVAVAKLHPDYTALILPEPGILTARGYTARSTAPVALRLTGTTLTGQAMGKGNLNLLFPKEWAGRTLLIGGKPAATFDAQGQISVDLPGEGAVLQVVETKK
ncbi:MAG: hypothetical protein ACYDBB_17175 [Armatimonadota bacterium]